MIYRNLNNYSISYYAGYFKRKMEDGKMQLKEYSTAAAVDVTAIPPEVFSILAKIVLRAAARSEETDESDKTAELW